MSRAEDPMPNTSIICPMCKSDAQTVHGVADEYDGWITACRCTKGRSHISAGSALSLPRVPCCY